MINNHISLSKPRWTEKGENIYWHFFLIEKYIDIYGEIIILNVHLVYKSEFGPQITKHSEASPSKASKNSSQTFLQKKIRQKCSLKASRLNLQTWSTQRMRFIQCTTTKPLSSFTRAKMVCINGPYWSQKP